MSQFTQMVPPCGKRLFLSHRLVVSRNTPGSAETPSLLRKSGALLQRCLYPSKDRTMTQTQTDLTRAHRNSVENKKDVPDDNYHLTHLFLLCDRTGFKITGCRLPLLPAGPPPRFHRHRNVLLPSQNEV